MKGLIVKNISDLYTIKSQEKLYNCKAKGIFRKKGLIPTVGDEVLFDENKLIITDILERKNILVRPPVANIDQSLIVMSTINPNFSTYLVDKLILMSELNNIRPIILVTKVDLEDNIDELLSYYQKIGYKVIKNDNLEEVMNILKNKITVITGQSGVGKSTLINKLDNSLSLKTNDISLALGRGKHTTRHTELYDIANGYIIDTPGFSSLYLNVSKEQIRDNIIEFNDYKCKYKDCMHINEDECVIKKLVKENIILKSRYENYVKFINEIKNIY